MGPRNFPSVGVHEAFNRVHDGAVMIDPDLCALALFVTMEGEVHVRSQYTSKQVAGMLRELATKMERK